MGLDARKVVDGFRGAAQGDRSARDTRSRCRGLDVRDHWVEEVGRKEEGSRGVASCPYRCRVFGPCCGDRLKFKGHTFLP